RAEKSHTRRHLSEFYGIDIEAAYMTEKDVMKVAEEVVLKCIQEVSANCVEDLQVLSHKLKTPKRPFPRISYADIVEDLGKRGGKSTVHYGDDLTDGTLSSFSRFRNEFFWIVEWPSELKPFYLEQGSGGLSSSFDLQFGPLELASGGKRVSKRVDLENNLKKAGLSPKSFENHLRVFDWGMPPHSGWGMGFDRLIMILTGRKNVREVVLYPRDRFRLEP
ncbi:MAG: amino acid--tRNA ligase-related protein, partial [Nitrososphaerales archaeon]